MLNRFNVMGIIGLIVATVLITLTNDNVMDGILLFALSGIALMVRTEDEESEEEEA